MSTYPAITIVDGEPTFEKPISEIIAEVKEGGALKVLSPIEVHTDQQRRWYKGVCLAGLSAWNGETVDEWDYRLKKLCGGGLLKLETWNDPEHGQFTRPTISGTGKRNMTQFIENILSLAITEDWPVTAPDENLRKK